MSTDELIASLCAGGRVDSDGEFTLDREQAREKLRTFQVAEPHRYVLHVVALAVLRGATRVRFEIETGELRARFDGEPLAAQDFEDLYSSSFAGSPRAAEQARQQLALAINAALALDPRHVQVTSGPPGARVRLTARHGAEDRIAAVVEGGEGTEIHVLQRVRPGLVVRFFRSARGALPELLALRERCRYSPIPIEVGGETIGGRLAIEAPGAVFEATQTDAAGRACVAALRPGRAPEVRLVRHGVWIESVSPEYLPPEAFAVVRDDRLATDLSATQAVRGDRFAGCVALAEATIELAIVAWLATLGGAVPAASRAGVRRIWRAWRRAQDPGAPLGRALAELPWWTDLFGRTLSLRQLRAAADAEGVVYFTSTTFAERLERWDETVVAAPRGPGGELNEDLLLLRELFAERVRDRTRELERAVRREANRRRWLARPTRPALPAGRYVRTASLEIGPIAGVIGLRAPGSGPATLRAIAEGHLVCELSLALPLAVDVALGGLEPDAEFDGPRRDERLALGLLAALDAALAMVETDMSSRTGDSLDEAELALGRRYLELRFDPGGPLAWLEAFGFTREAARKAVATDAGLGRICRPPAEVPLAALREPWLSECARLPTASGRALSLGAIALALERGQEVAWTGLHVRLPAIERIVLTLDAEARALAWRVFGARLRELAADEVQALVEEQQFLALPVEAPALPAEPCVAAVRVVDGAFEAVLGVLADRSGHPPLRARVRVLVRGRFVVERTIWAPLPGIRGALSFDRLRPTPDFSEVIEDEAWAAAERAIRGAVPRLAAATIEAVRAGAAPAWALADVLSASFPTAALRGAWDRLRATEGPAAAEEAYLCLLALATTVEPRELESALVRALAVPGSRVDPVALADRLGGRVDPRLGRAIGAALAAIRACCGAARTIADEVAGAAPELLALLELRRADRARVTVLELREAIARGETDALGRDAWIVGPAEASFLRRFFGEAAFGAVATTRERHGLPRAPADALVQVAVDGGGIVGALWLPCGVEEPACRVEIVEGDARRRVSLLPSLPLAGALRGEGVALQGFAARLTTAAREIVLEAAIELYQALLAREDAEASRAARRLDGRIGAARLPPGFAEVRERLGHRAAAAPREEVGGGSVLEAMFEALEAEAAEVGPRRDAGARTAAAIEPPPPVKPAEERLLEAICGELRALRELHDRLLSNFNLEHLRLATLDPGADPAVVGPDAVVLNAGHPLVQRAAAAFERDAAWIDVLASLVFTAFNVWRHEITDADEQEFHRLQLIRLAARGARA